MADTNSRRIVLIGKTGSGKSSLANTIFGDNNFKVNHSSDSKTRFSEAQTKTVNGRSLTLIDTPGVFNVDRSKNEIQIKIYSCLTECAPGPHAFLFVLSVEKFTEQEQAIIDQFTKHFSEEAFRYTTVVFTHGDQLPDDTKITEFVRQSKGLNELVQKCGGRCHVVDYRYWKNKPDDEYRSNQYQVAQILGSIENTVQANDGGCFTNSMLQKVEGDIEKEQTHIMTTTGLSPEESRKQAKAKVLQKYIDNLSKPRLNKKWLVIAGLFPLSLVIVPKLMKSVSPLAVDEVLGPSVVEVVQEVVSPIKQTLDFILGTIEVFLFGRRSNFTNTTTGGHTVEGRAMDVQTPTRIVILGKTGNGKSSLGNTILQDQLFPISHSSNTKSNYCTKNKSVNGKSITLIETPSFFDTCDSEEEFKGALVKSITDCAPGPHAFLIVLKVERYTVHEQEVIHQIHKYFSDEAFRFAVVVFTHGDQLPEGQTIEQFVAQNVALNGLVQKCGGRCHVVDNKYWKNTAANQYRNNQVQVAQLLNTVDTIIKGNNNGYYTNEMFQEVMKALKEEENYIRNKELSELSPAAIREKARSNVSERWVTILAGTTTGVLMGALLGVVEMVRSTLLTTQSLSGLSRGTLALAALGGIVSGGIRGYEASIEATSPQEAVMRVFNCSRTTMNESGCV